MLLNSLPVSIRARLAPTPSGLLHPGNALNFILTWAITRAQDGHLLLRIDDLDKARRRDEYLEDIFRSIEWLGIDYDEGPEGVDDLKNNWSQDVRIDLYYEALDTLKDKGHLFACSCSRRMIRAISTDGKYPGTCEQKALNFKRKDVAWRICPQRAPLQLPFRQIIGEDKVISLSNLNAFFVKQKNGFPAYQLSSIVDDEYFKINTIVRGLDLLKSTRYQFYLAHLLNNDTFQDAYFHHHEMLLNQEGEKLSKSKKATSLSSWQAQGRTPDELFQKTAQLLGITSHCPDGPSLVQQLKAALQS